MSTLFGEETNAGVRRALDPLEGAAGGFMAGFRSLQADTVRFCWDFGSGMSSIHSVRSRIFCDHLRQLRRAAGMSQRDLAAALGRVVRIELGERRVDFVEAYEIFKALGTSPETEAAKIMVKFEKN